MEKIRRYDLDWLRVLVFGLLILYHVGMVFVPWGYHIKNNQVSRSLVVPMGFINQWRLPILFVISGMGTRFALSFRSASQFFKERFKRLMVPLIFGILVVIPPQTYLERTAGGQQYQSFFHFYPDFFKGIYPAGNFTWNHLWFLPYLFVFSVILLPLFITIRNQPQCRFILWLKKAIQQKWGLFLPVIPLFLLEILLLPLFPVIRNLYHDWYAFAHYLSFFLTGFILVSVKEEFWESAGKTKFICLLGGIVTAWLRMDIPSFHLYSLVKVLNIWFWILAIFGFAAQFLNKKSALLTYANRAVYPFYILHQTLTLIAAFYLKDLRWSIYAKFTLLSLFTFLGCLIIYEFLIRRIKFLGPLFGLKNKSLYQSGADLD